MRINISWVCVAQGCLLLPWSLARGDGFSEALFGTSLVVGLLGLWLDRVERRG